MSSKGLSRAPEKNLNIRGLKVCEAPSIHFNCISFGLDVIYLMDFEEFRTGAIGNTDDGHRMTQESLPPRLTDHEEGVRKFAAEHLRHKLSQKHVLVKGRRMTSSTNDVPVPIVSLEAFEEDLPMKREMRIHGGLMRLFTCL